MATTLCIGTLFSTLSSIFSKWHRKLQLTLVDVGELERSGCEQCGCGTAAAVVGLFAVRVLASPQTSTSGVGVCASLSPATKICVNLLVHLYKPFRIFFTSSIFLGRCLASYPFFPLSGTTGITGKFAGYVT